MSIISGGTKLGQFPNEAYCKLLGAISIREDVCQAWHNTDMFDTSVSGLFTRLLAIYELRDHSELKKSLMSDPYLVMGLTLAANAIRLYFLDAQLALDLYKDREDPDYQTIALRIMTRIRYPASREHLLRFRNEWWTHHIPEVVRDKITLGVEPV